MSCRRWLVTAGWEAPSHSILECKRSTKGNADGVKSSIESARQPRRKCVRRRKCVLEREDTETEHLRTRFVVGEKMEPMIIQILGVTSFRHT
jgi:hypothetical protein